MLGFNERPFLKGYKVTSNRARHLLYNHTGTCSNHTHIYTKNKKKKEEETKCGFKLSSLVWLYQK